MKHRYLKYVLLLLPDMAAIPVAWFFAWLLVENFNLASFFAQNDFSAGLTLLMLIQGVFYWLFSLYRGVWRFASVPDFLRIVKAVGVTTLVSAILFHAIHMQYLPNIVLPLYFFILTGLLGAARLSFRTFINYKTTIWQGTPVLIVGAGQGGELLLRDLLRDPEKEYLPVGFVDDAYAKQGREIYGVRVLGRIDDIPLLAKRHEVKQIFVGIPSASSALMRHVMSICNKASLPVRTLPGLNNLAKHKVGASLLREVSVDDLLGREPVTLDWQNIVESLRDKIILITGGGGSIGSELCKQIARFNPDLLIVVDHSEFNLYTLQNNLEAQFPQISVKYELLSVTDQMRIKTIFQRYKPHIVFHAAAYKHVPILEDQIESAVINNIIGTKTIVDEAVAAQVETFVLISTDKAVNPTNIMGATKRSAEIYCQSQHQEGITKFITVRFGNVLGSAGSVIPLFKKQIEAGGPVTVTHPDTMRYFMTIPEACQLIMQAFAMGEGGEIFVLEMGEPVKIKDLAEQLILLSGHRVNSDIQIKYIGLRPGEKMVEELFHSQEALMPTKHHKILQARSRILPKEQIERLFDDMLAACAQCDKNNIIQALSHIVPEYVSANMDQADNLSQVS